jgi:peptide/nickel transport system ATP-binding protein
MPMVDILEDVSVSIGPGEAVGIVGESGSGKSTLARTILRIHRPRAGRIVFFGEDIAQAGDAPLKRARERMQMIFQDSQSALNPRHRIGDILAAPYIARGRLDRRRARDAAADLLSRVGLSSEHLGRYPHQLSGGQRQRIGIAKAIALEPALIIADEIVSGLDVSVQVQILDLLKTLRKEGRMALIFISHDLSVVRTVCERAVVMREGRVVEAADCGELFQAPRHPYTRMLLRSIPLPVVEPTWLTQDLDATE